MSEVRLERKLGLWAAVSVLVGSVIGSSIFMKPAVMAQQLGNPLLIMFVWILAGAISFIGAMINAEIGAMLPETGGQLIYFKKIYGEKFAFLYGWSAFALINTASVAAIAFVFAQYTSYFIELPNFSNEIEQSVKITIPFVGNFFLLENIGTKLLAAFVVVLLTIANCISVTFGGSIQFFLSILKVGLLVALVGLIFIFGDGDIKNITKLTTDDSTIWQIGLGIVAALSGAFAAFDGWNNIGFIAGEMKNPEKNISRSLFIGLGICMVLYILTNLAYFYVMPIEEAAKSKLIATDAVLPILGIAGTGFIAIMVMISTFGATNGNILACSRVTHAMGVEGDFFKWTGVVNSKYYTPANALWLHCIWTCMFIFSGSFDMLTDLFVFVTWLFYGFAAYGIFILRKKMPHANRPYKAWGYPILPAIFVLFTFFYSVLTIYNDVQNYLSGKTQVINASLGLVIMLSGLVVWWIHKKWWK